ncbi:unnamed protein product [Meganyctiphanes norvegica]|uniref:C2H2-type domain-containing protein n=1 Tax=Meganyctiphanes norvegica TaxID=48144 RepID=A0AAV2R463_MEGNR
MLGMEDSEFEAMGSMEQPPGTLLFSPQDLLRPAKTPRGRGRGRLQKYEIGGMKQEPDSAIAAAAAATAAILTNGGTGANMEMPVACEVCGKVMMTGKTLVQHMAIHSDLKPFQCPHCPKSFARKVHLQGHLVVHGIEKQFECPICHQRFSRQDCVKVHMRLHDKSKCVFCDVCHKAFLTVGALNIHLRIHRGEKPFKCHLCGKCFTQKNHLITHIKRHTKVTDEHFTKKLGPRMFKCEHCPRSFIRLSDYERHVQWNHGAVAEGAMVDKLPTVENLLDGEMKQTGLAPQIFKAPKDTLNNKPRPKKNPKKVMCTTSTQTDEDGGHIIIPRQYQNQMSSGTQMSAPPTPMREEDMYENDIFDDNIDRNYSSESDGDDDDIHRTMKVKREAPSMMSSTETHTMSAEAAFDAIVSSSNNKAESSQSMETFDSSNSDSQNSHSVVLSATHDDNSQERVVVINAADNDRPTVSYQNEDSQLSSIDDHDDNVYTAREQHDTGGLMVRHDNGMIMHQGTGIMVQEDERIADVDPQESLVAGDPQESFVAGDSQESFVAGDDMSDPNFPQNFEDPVVKVKQEGQPSPPKRGVGRGRGSRGGRKADRRFAGLSGAAELRAIRKNMIQSVAAAQETLAAGEGWNQEVNEEGEGGRGKRVAGYKGHDKNYVCNMKNCETCAPPVQIKTEPKPKVKVVHVMQQQQQISQQQPQQISQQQSQQISQLQSHQLHKRVQQLQQQQQPRPVQQKRTVVMTKVTPTTVVHGAFAPNNKSSVPSLKRDSLQLVQSDSKKMKKDDDQRVKVGNRVGNYPVDITASPLTNKSKKVDYFVTSNSTESIVSPPVELQSFCIPTYSCKLCGREFRFEGKLHRHIESVHQNKPIFSPDVKPGRNSNKNLPPLQNDMMNSEPIIQQIQQQVMVQPPTKKREPVNPEIAALRSEWSDDEDEGEEEELEEPVSTQQQEMIITTTSSNSNVNYTTLYAPQPINPRDIAPTTTTLTDAHHYSSGVKVNMNKLAGLLPRQPMVQTPGSSKQPGAAVPEKQNSSKPRTEAEVEADTLDMKCQRLLQKLFDHDLLMNCGLLEKHVSVVLGKVLQHYGVKMIEDYGQGQYEVLKYNLWRLIEWKVTMEQMEEFYTAGKSVEEMMEDIMNERVPLVQHHFVPRDQAAAGAEQDIQQHEQQTQQHVMEAVDVTDGQMVLQQFAAGTLGTQLNLPEGVTQVMLAQDVPPDLLQGAHIVTIDPATGQVISQVTADQVILADAITEDLEHQVSQMGGGQVVQVSQASGAPQVIHTGQLVQVSQATGQVMTAEQFAAAQQQQNQSNIVVTHTTAGPVTQMGHMVVHTSSGVVKVEAEGMTAGNLVSAQQSQYHQAQ